MGLLKTGYIGDEADFFQISKTENTLRKSEKEMDVAETWAYGYPALSEFDRLVWITFF